MDVLSRARVLMLSAAALLVTFQSPAQSLVVKETLEASAGMIVMPTSADGMMTVTTCSTCKAKIFRSTTKTAYKLRDTPVSFNAFRQALAISSDTYVSVQFVKSSAELLSVTASIDPPAGTPATAPASGER